MPLDLQRHRHIIVPVILLIATCAAYWQVANCDFVNYDDGAYVVENSHVKNGLTLSNVVWAFSTLSVGNWHPVTWISYMLDYQLFGSSPRAYHLTNLFLHLINTILLLIILNRMTHAYWQSAFVAALFALHPLHVESVAWIAERKDVLCALFWLLTIGAYDCYVKRPCLGRYLWVCVFFVLGLMSKPMVVTLPLILFLLDYWPFCRLQIGKPADCPIHEIPQVKNPKRLKQISKKKGNEDITQQFEGTNMSEKWALLRPLIWEKIPLLAAAGIAGMITLAAQQKGGAIALPETYPLVVRIENALVSYMLYIGKMVWPQDLIAFYSHPGTYPLWESVGSALILFFVTVAVIWIRKKYPYLIIGWLWYLVTLLPVIGIIQVGSQSIADRYTYLPLIGIFIMIAWFAWGGFPTSKFKGPILVTASLSILLACSLLTRAQVLYWKDSVTLFQHVLNVTGSNWVTNLLLGNAYAKEGRCSDAIEYLSVSVRQNPGSSPALPSLMSCLDDLKRMPPSGIGDHHPAEKYQNLSYQYNIVGFALLIQKKAGEAIPYLQKAIETKPDYAEAEYNMGNAMVMSGRIDEAVDHYRKALRIMPDYAEAHNNIGSIFFKRGKSEEAIHHFSEALRLKPMYDDAKKNLQITLKNKGQGSVK